MGELVWAASKAWLTGSTILAVLARCWGFFSFYLTLVQDEVPWTPPKGGETMSCGCLHTVKVLRSHSVTA